MKDEMRIEDLIKIMPPKTAVYNRTVRSGMPVEGGNNSFGIRTDFIVRDTTAVIKSLEQNPQIALVVGLVHDTVENTPV